MRCDLQLVGSRDADAHNVGFLLKGFELLSSMRLERAVAGGLEQMSGVCSLIQIKMKQISTFVAGY
jgi:hypothetical protein